MGFQRRASDAELIARVRAGDTASFEELYQRHIDNSRRVAGVVAWSGEEAEDVAAEALTSVLALLRDGGGPDGELAPYLRTVIRRLVAERHRAAAAGHGTPGNPVDATSQHHKADLVTAHSMVRQAYETLPPRWQQVLWRSEIEGEPPGALAAAFDSTPDAAAALAYRAREGLRRAYLGLHLARGRREECKAVGTKVSALARGALDVEDRPAVRAHLAECAACRERYEEMLLLVTDLPGVLTPALLGIAAPRPAATAGAGAPVPAGSAAAEAAPRLSRRDSWRGRVTASSGVMVGTLLAATVAVLLFALAVANIGPLSDEGGSAPAAAGTPSDDPPRLSVETATPQSSETTVNRSATPEPEPTAEPEPEPTEEPTPEPDGRDSSQQPEQDTSSDISSGSSSSDAPSDEDTTEPDSQRQAQTTEAAAPEPTSAAEPSDKETDSQPTPDGAEVAALEAAARAADPPDWWCDAVPWWPQCSEGSQQRRWDDDSRERGSRDGESDWTKKGSGVPIPPGLSRSGLCEWLPDLPPCLSSERDRHGGGSGR